MTIHIPISADTEAKLREDALAAGKDITSFILEILEEEFSETAFPEGPSSDPARLLQGLDPTFGKESIQSITSAANAKVGNENVLGHERFYLLV